MDESLITALYFENMNDCYCKNYIIFKDADNNISACICDKFSKQYIRKKYGKNIKFYKIHKTSIIRILEKSFADLNTYRAHNYLSQISDCASAITINYKKMVVGFGIIFVGSVCLLINLFNVLNNTIYLMQNILKIFLFKRSVANELVSSPIKYNGALPIYTIFVPLYKEASSLQSIINAIDALDYPKDKLDVKFITEADDAETNKTLSTLCIPYYIQLVKVPYSMPRTKPKAMNYAVPYIKGAYLCVFDAEDVPDPQQLMKALQGFASMPEEYACMQARLGFYNGNSNILTKFFAIEYSLWFEYLLNGLSLYDLPLTLGGTSNHFKIAALKDVGYWDAYNVTEDADLGIRLYAKGYKVHIIDSDTLEEAPSDLINWLSQRTRWIKGFIQTFYVFLKNQKHYRHLGLKKIISIYIFVGFSSYSFICMPWLVMVFLFKMNQYIYYLWFANTVISLTYMYSSVWYISNKKKSIVIDYVIIIFWPLYFTLHTIAAYMAIIEIFRTPFRWNKTKHGEND